MKKATRKKMSPVKKPPTFLGGIFFGWLFSWYRYSLACVNFLLKLYEIPGREIVITLLSQSLTKVYFLGMQAVPYKNYNECFFFNCGHTHRPKQLIGKSYSLTISPIQVFINHSIFISNFFLL